MTPLLPTIGQDFGEVGQKSSDAALSNLLLKYQKLHPDLDISSAMFVFIPPSSKRFTELSIGLWAPSLSSPPHPAGNNFCKLNRHQLVLRIDFEQQ